MGDGAPRVTEATESHPLPHHPYDSDLAAGTMVGDYRIERKLGQGGMGAVYAAVHPIIDKRVAIKVLRRELSASDEAVSRFIQEARAVNRIGHPSIVDVFGYGSTADARCFLVMELLEGESLGARLQRGPLDVADACDVLIAITHALDAAHACGIVHRDLKPDNVFLVDGKHVKLLDFGIAKLIVPSERGADYTQPGQAIGTPRYIAPEQALGEMVDGGTDIYSLGVMAFELLTGAMLFVGDNPMELVAKHITTAPPIPSDVAPSVPPAADVLLLQMLDKKPANRPSLQRVRELLEDIRAQSTVLMSSMNTEHEPVVSVVRPIDVSSHYDLVPPRRGLWIPALIGVAVLGVAIGWSVVRRDPASAAVVQVPNPTLAPTQDSPPPMPPVAKPAAIEPEPNVEAPAAASPVVTVRAAKPTRAPAPTPRTVAKTSVAAPAQEPPAPEPPPAATPPAAAPPAVAAVPDSPHPPPPKPRVEDDGALMKPFRRKTQ